MSVTITSVGVPEEISFDDGTVMLKYGLDLSDGSMAEAWRPKSGNKFPPKEGDEGTVTNGKFKKNPKPGSDGGSVGSYGGGGGKGMSPEREARIVRQHSQEMALRCVAAGVQAAKNLDELTALIDWFDKDVLDAEPAAPAKPDLDTVRNDLIEWAKKENVPLNFVADAIKSVTGSTDLDEGGLDKIGQIKTRANEFVTHASAEDDIPF